jgi:hypothetical protein
MAFIHLYVIAFYKNSIGWQYIAGFEHMNVTNDQIVDGNPLFRTISSYSNLNI